jgi:type IV pilus assembly protein PilQ
MSQVAMNQFAYMSDASRATIFSRIKRGGAVFCLMCLPALSIAQSQSVTDAPGAKKPPAPSAAQTVAQGNAIETVTSSQQGNITYLRISLKDKLAMEPGSFSVANPPRVAIDFANTEVRTAQNNLELNQGDVRSVSLVQAGNRSRVVLNLKRPLTYTTAQEGKDLIVTLTPLAVSAIEPAAAPAYSFAKPEAKVGAAALRDIDFRRGKEGEGRLVVDLSNPQIGVDIKQQGSTIVVDFLRTALPDNLRRRLDVGDFGTPVKFVRAVQQGENARLIIEPTGLWEHNAYQSDNQFIVEVKAVKEDPNKLVQGTRLGYRGDRLSLNFQSVDVRALLQVIADFTNLNIVTSDSVAGSLTLRLKDVPWDQALDIIMQSKGLDMRKNGNVLLIAPRDELATKEKLELEAKQQVTELEPLRTVTFQLNYQKAEVLQKLLTDSKQTILSKRGSVVVDQRTNKLFVQDIATRLDDLARLITQVDIPVRQVLIEARIVEADDRFSRNLGVKLGYNDLSSTVYKTVSVSDPVTGVATALNVPVYGAGQRILGSTYGTVSGNLRGSQDLSSQAGSDITGSAAGVGSVQGLGRSTNLDNTNFVNLPAGGINGNNAASFAISLFGSSLTKFLNLELSALEADQRGKVISSPRVLTADQGKAIIEQGTEIPFQSATSSGATAVSFKKANLSLEVTPQITPEGAVILDVKVNRDSVGQLTPAGFAINTRRVATQVLVENGGTVVIGGVYEQTERNVTNKVPVLGDVPFIGNLFKNNQRQNDRTELLVFLTPRIMTDTGVSR